MFEPSGRLSIKEFIIQETGTFNDQWTRPYVADVHNDSLENLSQRIASVTRGNVSGQIYPNSIAGLTNGLIYPSAHVENQIAIPQGWRERRFRFILVVEENNGFGTQFYHFQGYSEYFDTSLSGYLPPDMVFFINSYIKINRVKDYSNPGMYTDKIIESRRVTPGQAFLSPSVYGLREEDLFVGLQSEYIRAGYDYTGSQTPVNDTRIGLSNSVFGAGRSSSIPSSYLGKVIDNYRSASSLLDFGQGQENVFDRTIQLVHEPSPLENPFIRLLTAQRGLNVPSNTFTMSDLISIDPTVPQRTNYYPADDLNKLSQAGQSEVWTGADLKTRISAVLFQSVTSLMVECGIISLQMFTTNMTIDQSIQTSFLAAPILVNQEHELQSYNLFVNRFNKEIVPDITSMNQVGISITIVADIYNETTIDISVDGDPLTRYTAPSFCDGLLQPYYTTSTDNYNSLINGVETILNYCGIQPTIDHSVSPILSI